MVGRDPQSGLVLEDLRVSKQHARLSWNGSGWSLFDLGSKNGTSVDGVAANGAPLPDSAWISFGGVLGHFERISEEKARSLAADRLARLDTSMAMRRRLAAARDPLDLLSSFLESAVELTAAERGFVVVKGGDGALHAEVAAGFQPQDIAAAEFAGSLTALERVLATGSSIVVSDAQADAFLGKRPSVVGMGLRGLACLPLRDGPTVVGALYLDGKNRSEGFTEVDLEILEGLADHAAVAIAAARLHREVERLAAAPAPGRSDALTPLQGRLGTIAWKAQDPSAASGGTGRWNA